jgi:hypothetical protein
MSNINTQTWKDPKEAIVSLDGLIRLVEKIQNYLQKTYGNTSDIQNEQEINKQINFDVDERIFNNETRNETPNKWTRNLIDNDSNVNHTLKNQRICGGFGNNYHHDNNNNRSLIIRNNNQQNHANNTSTIFNQYDINEQSIPYSVDSHLPPIVLECRPTVKSKETAAKLATSFINFISNDFRKQNPSHTSRIGFDYWWQDADGARLLGVVKDIDLFLYL